MTEVDKLDDIADRFTEAETFAYLDEAYATEDYWRRMKPMPFESLGPEDVIVFGGATCRVNRALAWLKDRQIEYPFAESRGANESKA